MIAIGGVDPTGQSGLARDVASAAAYDVHCAPVPSALTVQTTAAFEQAVPTDPELLEAMLEAALTERPTRIVKVGALWTPAQAQCIAAAARKHELQLVVDPVLASTSGQPFLDPQHYADLWQHTVLATPNRSEAEALGHLPCPTLVTGGDADVLGNLRFRNARIPGTHRGTGCRLATRIAALLSLDLGLEEAVTLAHGDLQEELRTQAQLAGAAAQHVAETRKALWKIVAAMRYVDVPEVGSNFAYAMPGATHARDHVAGLAGRITIAGFHRGVAGRVAMGGPHHTGRIAVVLQEYDPHVRVVMNHRYDPSYIARARAAGLVDASFCRSDEPADVPSSMEWGVRHAISKAGCVPDLIWDEGGPGKEPMIRITAKDPDSLVAKLRMLHDTPLSSCAPASIPTCV